MPQFIEPDIVIPALKTALAQLSELSLSKIGLDVTELPFWLAIIGFPLAVFDTCTKHIATALNLLLHKFHFSLREITSLFIPLLGLIALVVVILFLAFEKGDIQWQVTQPVLASVFYYAILATGLFACVLFISSLSRITGQGNFVTGIGFLLGTISIFIEVVLEFGTFGQIACSVTLVITVGLWFYGKRYNDKMAMKKQRERESRYYTRQQERRTSREHPSR